MIDLQRAMCAAEALCRACGAPYEVGDGSDGSLSELEQVLDFALDLVREAQDGREQAISASSQTGREARILQIRRLAAGGWDDPKIARTLGISDSTVRRIRRTHEIPAGMTAGSGPPRSGWEVRLRAAHERGMTVEEMASHLQCTANTIRSRLSALGLRAHRRRAR